MADDHRLGLMLLQNGFISFFSSSYHFCLTGEWKLNKHRQRDCDESNDRKERDDRIIGIRTKRSEISSRFATRFLIIISIDIIIGPFWSWSHSHIKRSTQLQVLVGSRGVAFWQGNDQRIWAFDRWNSISGRDPVVLFQLTIVQQLGWSSNKSTRCHSNCIVDPIESGSQISESTTEAHHSCSQKHHNERWDYGFRDSEVCPAVCTFSIHFTLSALHHVLANINGIRGNFTDGWCED